MAAEQSAKAGSSRFAVTCGLLRQYMKEQGGNGGRCIAPIVTMSLMPGADVIGAAEAAPEERKTMELFPQQAGTLKGSQERRDPEKAPLTIFYGGTVLVFDDFPAEKTDELMQLAGSCNPPAASDVSGAAAVVCQNALGQPCLPDMPIARKASLQRFLEKRKNRLAERDPYPVASAPAEAAKESSKPVKEGGAPWLGVNSMLSLS